MLSSYAKFNYNLTLAKVNVMARYAVTLYRNDIHFKTINFSVFKSFSVDGSVSTSANDKAERYMYQARRDYECDEAFLYDAKGEQIATQKLIKAA